MLFGRWLQTSWGFVSTGVVAAVLLSAVVHAGWNALIKGRTDPLTASVGLSSTWAILGIALIPVVPLPAPQAWPWLAGSVAIHLGYLSAMVLAYRVGDLSLVYPLMRGLPPIGVTALAALWLGEWPAPAAALGLSLVIGGVVVLVRRRPQTSVLVPALGAAGCITAYTVADGVGVRASGSVVGYLVWLATLQGGLFAAGALLLGGRPLAQAAARRWRVGLASGILSMGGYLVALWAMGQAPIAVVAALRETSVVFAALIGAVWLSEPLGIRRGIAAALVASGAIVLRLSG